MAFERQLKTPISIDAIKNHDLYGVLLQARGEAGPLDDNAIKENLIAAEDYLEKELGIRWNPTRVFSDPLQRTAGFVDPRVVVSDFNPLADIAEPAYDYNRDFFTEERWAYMDLNFRQVREIPSKFFFSYPGSNLAPSYEVPRAWLRIDHQFGRVQIVPTSGPAVFLTFNTFILSVLTGGRGLPQSIYVDYVTGFTSDELLANHQDLLKLVRLTAVLFLMESSLTTIAAPGGVQNASLSLDGLSRSRGFGGKYGPYSGRIELAMAQQEKLLNASRRRLKGIVAAWA